MKTLLKRLAWHGAVALASLSLQLLVGPGMVLADETPAAPAAAPAAPAAPAPPTLMSYEIDIVSDYILRGENMYIRDYAKDPNNQKAEESFPVAPALQPSITLYGPSGFSFTAWGSFALQDRDDDTAKGFVGLAHDDEMDFTFDYNWTNKLGGFDAGLIAYTYLNKDYNLGATTTNRYGTAAQDVPPDYYVKWTLPWMTSINPTIADYVSSRPGAYYGAIGIGGGESIVWSGNLGVRRGEVNDVTGSIGYPFGSFKVSASGSYRPNPDTLGYLPASTNGVTYPPDNKGNYFINQNGTTVKKSYEPAIFWLTLSWLGSVN